MNYMQRSAQTPRWDYRRAATLLVLACFFATVTGGAGLLHHHDGPADAAHPCQICYLLTVASAFMAVAFVFLFSLGESRLGHLLAMAPLVHLRDLLTSAAPRAPPQA